MSRMSREVRAKAFAVQARIHAISGDLDTTQMLVEALACILTLSETVELLADECDALQSAVEATKGTDRS